MLDIRSRLRAAQHPDIAEQESGARRQLRHIRQALSYRNPAHTQIYTLSLHDALPICIKLAGVTALGIGLRDGDVLTRALGQPALRSEEHTSELQSQSNIVCRRKLE